MGGNPVSMVDPDGDLAFLAIVGIGAAVFGTTNFQAANVNNFWDGLETFGSGAVAGAVNLERIPGTSLTTHRVRWYERQANRFSARYFGRHYGVDWDLFDNIFPRLCL